MTRSEFNRRSAPMTIILALAGTLWGCAASGDSRANPVPASTRPPVQVQLTVGLPSDADGNGYPDTVQALAYLFPASDDTRESKLPVAAKGSFEFVMQNAAGTVLARWVFPPDVVDRAARHLPAGVGYSMYLRLAEGEDVMAPMGVDIRCRFITADGADVRGLGRATVRLGG
ncbi:MAG: hypothetical protein DYG94_05445 [Leptolyngbya sp. PLA3]|nr:MAG: hypothetical protein EDM82_04675 [Cyanobacteria bacterium CYA]MCE7968178.1 hypothetical protein [Leptolyngbya sp. PL-A3]